MHRKLIVGSVAALALAAPSSALATGSCNASGKKSQAQCGSQSATTNQVAVAKTGKFTLSSATAWNNATTVQSLKQIQNRGLLIKVDLGFPTNGI